tara:strand:- start:200 stop:598 length:399 start_codon:yes stop_codon:yes gene_type:complete
MIMTKLKLDFKADVYLGVTRQVANFTGTLLSIAKTPIENSNKTLWYPSTCTVTDSAGTKQDLSCMIYATSFDKGMEIGQDYLGSVTIEKGQAPLIKLTSGIGNGVRATLDMFDMGDVADVATVAEGNLSDIG